jgi:acetyl/propionyl-CoA carboxylase alpha subunit
MAAALDDFVILGIHTTIGFLKDIINHPEFRAGRTNTAFIKNYFEGWKESGKSEDKLRLALAAAAFDDLAAEARPGAGSAREAKQDVSAPWKTLGRWRIGGAGSHGI